MFGYLDLLEESTCRDSPNTASWLDALSRVSEKLDSFWEHWEMLLHTTHSSSAHYYKFLFMYSHFSYSEQRLFTVKELRNTTCETCLQVSNWFSEEWTAQRILWYFKESRCLLIGWEMLVSWTTSGTIAAKWSLSETEQVERGASMPWMCLQCWLKCIC